MIHWYDWVTPTNPFASLFFGILLTVFVCLMVWWETKDWKVVRTSFVSGVAVSIIGVFLLTVTGFYS
ncbi:hypothetical protein LCL95_01205 [Bacillus timonensis]|nr:hypothetical protein [Bacillus timonensis]